MLSNTRKAYPMKTMIPVLSVCHEGQYFDSKGSDSYYGRIAVDYVEAYLDEPIKPGKEMYIVYYCHDYRKENFIKLYATFDDMDKAIEFAREHTNGKDSEAEYACHNGEYFDQKDKDGGYGRIAVDGVYVGDDTS